MAVHTLTISIFSPLSDVKPSGTCRACMKAWVNWGMKGNNSCLAIPCPFKKYKHKKFILSFFQKIFNCCDWFPSMFKPFYAVSILVYSVYTFFTTDFKITIYKEIQHIHADSSKKLFYIMFNNYYPYLDWFFCWIEFLEILSFRKTPKW